MRAIKQKIHSFFMTPSVHTFLYNVYQQEKYLSELFACIAEMDAYNAIATKILKSGNANNKFCLAEFIENPTSSIEAQSILECIGKKCCCQIIYLKANMLF